MEIWKTKVSETIADFDNYFDFRDALKMYEYVTVVYCDIITT